MTFIDKEAKIKLCIGHQGFCLEQIQHLPAAKRYDIMLTWELVDPRECEMCLSGHSRSLPPRKPTAGAEPPSTGPGYSTKIR
jgi:hypothetical protein